MKNLKNIIALFLTIFIAGIIVIAISINTTLNKKEEYKTVQVKDTVYLLKVEKETV